MTLRIILTDGDGIQGLAATFGAVIQTNIIQTATDAAAAAASASQAATSATNASNSADAASASASSAATSASNASGSASAAAGSATAAGTSATNASNSASAASGSASAASTSATNAATSATNASNSATAAANSASNAAATLANALTKANNLSDVANATTARGNLSAAKSGANSDITSLSGLTTALSIAQGGTGATLASAARTALGAAATGTDLSQFAATTSAQLAGVLTDETGSGSAVFGTSPTINSPVLNGRTSSTALGSGEIGYRTPTVTGGPTGWSSNTWSAIVSITLQPGIWDIDGVALSGNSGNNLTNFAAAWATAPNVSTATFPEYIQFGGSALSAVNAPMPTKRVQVTTATTYYMNIFTGFSAGTQTTQGACWATRRG